MKSLKNYIAAWGFVITAVLVKGFNYPNWQFWILAILAVVFFIGAVQRGDLLDFDTNDD